MFKKPSTYIKKALVGKALCCSLLAPTVQANDWCSYDFWSMITKEEMAKMDVSHLPIFCKLDSNDSFGHKGKPIHQAIRYASVDVVKEFLKKIGTENLNAKTSWEYTPLDLAVARKNVELLELLWNTDGVARDPNIIYQINLNTSSDVIDFILNKTEYYDLDQALLRMPLFTKPQKIQFLLDKGADANATNENGQNALMLVLISSSSYSNPFLFDWEDYDIYLSLIQQLIDKGADVNARDDRGSTPFMIASQRIFPGAKKILEILINNGADPNATNESGQNALMLASISTFSWDSDAYAFVLEHTDDINAKNNDGKTAWDLLDEITGNSFKIEMAKELLEDAGADVSFWERWAPRSWRD